MLEAFTFSCLSCISSEPHELLRNNTQMICQKQASESLFHYNLKPVPLKHNWYLVDLFSILSILLLDVFTTCRKVVIDFDLILITTTISVLPDTPAIPRISHLKHHSPFLYFSFLYLLLFTKFILLSLFCITFIALIGELVSKKLTASRHIFLLSPNA